ncbi:hypothetical protein GS504_03890 [Rhodococcus hoagii]|nr:hypothetical protein [Prescottella equi]NKS56677.1 hypothetical protein [Prescottella equi]NKS68790.1 hypothetical protein [Prescottella equi]
MTSTDADENELQPPCVKGFVMILPEGIPVPDQTTWGFMTDELEPLLDGVEFRPTVSVRAPVPSDGVGRNFVSLRFWHVEDDTDSPFETDLRHLFKAFERIHPPDGRTSSPSQPPEDEIERPVRYRTVVEAVTFVASNDDLLATVDKPDPLTRCLNELFSFHRAYRATAAIPTEELTYAQIFPMVLTFRKGLEDNVITPDGLMHLSSDNIRFGALATHIGSVDADHLSALLGRQRLGDPLIAYVERRVDANYQMFTKGNLSGAVLQIAIACEVILDGLLGLVLWESGMTDTEAAEIFSSDITPRVKQQYQSRLGGNWSLTTGVLASWFDNVAGLRNRVVHAGYRPSASEASQANESADSVAKFISDRLVDRFKDYPKTAWLVVGQGGFEERNRLSRRVKDWIGGQPPNAVLDWVREYVEWREKVNSQVQIRRRSN